MLNERKGAPSISVDMQTTEQRSACRRFPIGRSSPPNLISPPKWFFHVSGHICGFRCMQSTKRYATVSQCLFSQQKDTPLRRLVKGQSAANPLLDRLLEAERYSTATTTTKLAPTSLHRVGRAIATSTICNHCVALQQCCRPNPPSCSLSSYVCHQQCGVLLQ